MQSDRGDCSLIAEIAFGLLRLQSDCGDCSLTETPWDDQVYMYIEELFAV